MLSVFIRTYIAIWVTIVTDLWFWHEKTVTNRVEVKILRPSSWFEELKWRQFSETIFVKPDLNLIRNIFYTGIIMVITRVFHTCAPYVFFLFVTGFLHIPFFQLKHKKSRKYDENILKFSVKLRKKYFKSQLFTCLLLFATYCL